MRIAVVGSGVSGLVCAYRLRDEHDVTLFESDSRPGGHAHTQRVVVEGSPVEVDTGFIVFNERNYPVLTSLFNELGIASQPSDMSFAMSDREAGIEWCGTSLNAIFAQRRNLFRPGFWRMLRDIAHFNREARGLLTTPADEQLSLREFLSRGHYSSEFVQWYLVPMGAAIWSADPATFTEFPARAFVRFFHNHGLLGVRNRPQWRTVVGGSQAYVSAIVRTLGESFRPDSPVVAVTRVPEGVTVSTSTSTELFDHVILATHADQSLALLSEPTTAESDVLGALRYSANEAVLHTDENVMPRHRRARASWNWRHVAGVAAPTLTYDLTRLQNLPLATRLYLTLNHSVEIDPATVLSVTTYAHPVFDAAAMAAQQRHHEISGHHGISFAGAYWGYGFHEDGARSAETVVAALRASAEKLA